jgi:TonB family protein
MTKTVCMLGLVVLTTATVLGQTVPQIDTDGIYTNGKGLTRPKLIHGAQAAYPSDQTLAKEKHVCALRVVIGADGTPSAIKILNQNPGHFDDAAIASVRQSQFEPAMYESSPVPTYLTLWVPFNVGKELAAPIEGSTKQKGVSLPVPLNTVSPEFPEQARKEKIDEGVVLVQVLVAEEGLPTNATFLRPAGHGFDENALAAVGKYRFKPATLHGVPVPMKIIIEVNFRR